MSAALSVGVDSGQPIPTVTAKGEVDLTTTSVWREAWSRLWQAGVTAPVVLADTTGVTFFGSAGITVLLEMVREARERGLELAVAASTTVRRSLQIVGVDSLIRVYDTLDEAQEHIGAARAGEANGNGAYWKPPAVPRPREDATPAELVRYLRAENLQLREALETRTVLEQAKGIVMAREEVSSDEAFEMLRRLSQRTNVKVYDLSAQLINRVARRGSRR
ncbi:anti-sigma factor antagonist [Amycolatopsis jiangsuensis]|uniref:Anti-sigma factor antagonist n=1 Tax=Amycolatopsis jiangsuensis TaxID=1181879 RepID=A0A840IZR0_9PSEU|nr:anti-sigma factor antagonist [Amycolatopsis jiangsuensis]MBB4686895.1 anti-anti-sigma factor [Amycolatopsis jiangsuensis]